MQKPKMKISPVRPVKSAHAAFGGGGNRAFRDPDTMVAPDQAFTSAMAKPQAGASVMPMPPMPSQGPA